MTERGGTDNRISGGTVNGSPVQAQSVGSVEIHHHYGLPSSPAAPEEAPHPWVSQVAQPYLWTRIPQDRDSAPTLAAARDIASVLAALHDDGERQLADDPWWDRGFAGRFLGHIVQLVCSDTDEDWDFHPVEVLLLTLTPYLSQTLWVRTAGDRVAVRPDDLRERGGDDLRTSFEKFCRDGHERLVRRATLGLPSRPGAESDIGWWLFHQWLDHDLRGRTDHWAAYEDLVGLLPLHEPPLRDAFARKRAGQLLYGLRLPLWEMCRDERLKGRYDTYLAGGSLPVPQKLRLKRVALLLAVARARALDAPALPDDLVENLGIPHPVDLEQLRTTVAEAGWTSEHGSMVLKADDCRHEAVVESLRQHVEQVDGLLDDVHRAARADEELRPLRALPHRALADGVEPARDENGRFMFESYSKFRVDPRRVQTLLMGDQLYRSPGLAVRELYQNALDACRYRAARTRYLEETREDGFTPDEDGWRGQIRFKQDVSNDGRPYLECWDNGIGMGESELTRVFARAGTRFTDLTDVRNERGSWEAVGIRMYPVSRFGIGVLSYFMIADEIEVVTRKMEEDGSTGECYKVAIYGPNHLFRIQPVNGRREAGTTVRLYLRDRAPSCVQELKRLLGFAEFDTYARHRALTAEWEAGEFRLRQEWRADEVDEGDSLRAYGRQVPGARGADAGPPQVVWCETGGGVLVDGILTRPTRRRGVLADGGRHRRRYWEPGTPRNEILRGAVVNLTGTRVPRLSIDRLQILDDVSKDVESLLRVAADDLARSTSPLLDFEWVAQVAGSSPKVADIIITAVMRAGRVLRLPGGRPFRPAEVGFLKEDPELIAWSRGDMESGVASQVPDHILLWRLIAHGETERLVEVVPELSEVGALLPAMPSDGTVFDDYGLWTDLDSWTPGYVLEVAVRTGISPRNIVLRASRLHTTPLSADRFPDAEPDPLDLALLSRRLDGGPGWLSTGDPVPLEHFIVAQLRHGLSISESVRRLEAYGFDVSLASGLPEMLGETDLELLSVDGDFDDWWGAEDPVPPGHVLAVAGRTGLTVAAVCERLRQYGLTVSDLPEQQGPDDLRLLSWNLKARPAWISPRGTVPYEHLLTAAELLGMDVSAVAAVLRAYGLHPQTVPPTEWSEPERLLLRAVRAPDRWSGSVPINCSRLWDAAEELGISLTAVMDQLRRLGMAGPLTFPEQPTDLDEALLVSGLALWDRRIDEADVSIRELLVTAHSVGKDPSLVAERLVSYGLRVPAYEELEAHDIRDGLLLLSSDLDSQSPWIEPEGPVRLGHLCGAAGRLGITIPEAADRLRRLGLDVPDVRDMIRAAMEKLPGRDAPNP
ncbi:hypothetical protein ABT186_05445 [Streptomyces sp. NPDC001634]|uniref:wHTH domain-containing protein n=1 Tax=Streptomyces sp. NPDC001634 TaxID=3154390 RepID=UPI00332A16CD